MRQITARPYAFKAPEFVTVAEGLTLAEMVNLVHDQAGVPEIWRGEAVVLLDGEPIGQDRWAFTVPDPAANVVVNTSLHGGGGDGNKNPLRIILTIVVVVVATITQQHWITAGYIGGAYGAAVAASVVTVAGMALVNAIAPIRPPGLSGSQQSAKESPTYSITGAQNNVRRFGTVPVILGSHRHTPPLGAMSYSEIVGNDEYLRMLVVWGYGPLLINNLRIGETSIYDYSDLEIEIFSGYDSDPDPTLFPSSVFQEQIGTTLSTAADWVQRTSQLDTDELSIDIVFPRGLAVINSDGTKGERTVQLEARYRKVGDVTWIDIEEDVAIAADTVTISQVGTEIESGVYVDAITGAVSTSVGAEEINGKIKIGRVYVQYEPTGFIVAVDNISAPGVSGAVCSLATAPTVFTNVDIDVSAGSIEVGMLTTRRASAQPVRVGYKIRIERGQYEVAIRRITAEDTSSQVILEDCVWSVLRSIKNESPLDFRQPLAMTALRIKATEQLSGVINTLNGDITTIAPIWDGADWNTEEPTNNPAALMRLVLTGPANDRARSSAQVDDDTLADFYDFCETNGYRFNMVRDFTASVWETLADIAAAGRGTPTINNGKWSVIWDESGKPVRQHFTPRNSWGFESSKILPLRPHAWRARFVNEQQDYKQDERIIYDDGYTAANATRFEGIEFPGVTDPDLVWKFGRFHIAQLRLRPEQYTFSCDLEHLACQRGDIVLVSHDVTMWGLAWGRVKELVTSGPNITGVIVDEKFPMETGKSYNVRFRLEDGTSYVRDVNTVAGENTELTFVTPTTENIQAGDLAMFGEAGSETQRLLVKAIDRGDNLTARLTCVDEGPAIYTADTGTIPDFDSNITLPVDVTKFEPNVPSIAGVESGTSALILVGNSLISRIIVNLSDGGGNVRVKEFQVRYRRQDNEEWLFASTVGENPTVDLWPVEDGETYEIQARAISDYGVVSAWSPVTAETVVGQGEVPPDVTGFTVNVVDKYALLFWETVAVIDFSHYRVKWSPATSGATWDSAVDVAPRVSGTSISIPAQVGTYLIKAYDRAGNSSENAATAATSIARLLGLNVVETITEPSPTWDGTMDRVYYDPNLDGLILDAAGDLYDAADLYDVGDLYVYGGLEPEGYYYLDGSIELGDVYTSRISGSMTVSNTNLLQDLYGIADLYILSDLYQAAGDFGAAIEIRYTEDDPAGTPTWSGWLPLVVGDYTARAFEVRVHLTGDGEAITPLLEEVNFTVDMPDRVYRFSANIASGGSRVAFSPAFYAFPDDKGLGISVLDGQEGDKYTISNLDETGFDIAFTNGGGNVARSISGIAQAYGEVNI